MQSEYEDALELRLPMFFEDIGASLLFEHDHAPVSRESLTDGFTLADKDTTANIYAHLDYQSKVSSAEAMLAGLGMGS